MILKRIVEFAERHAADQPTGYQPRFVTKIVQLNRDGTFRQVIPATGQKRGKREGVERMEPQESPARTVAIKPRLFADNVNYALGMAREKDNSEQVVARHLAWCELVRECAESVPRSEIVAVRKWIEAGGPEELRGNADEHQIVAEDDLTFEVDGAFPTELPEVRAFWANRAENASQAVCLVTGKTAAVADRMPAPIKGVPDGQMSGTAFVSVNSDAGESYGLEAALNSPISVDAAEKLCNGLNVLLNEHVLLPDDKGKERRKYKYSLRVGRSVYLAWARNDSDAFDLFRFFDAPDPADVHDLIRQPLSGKAAPSEFQEKDFFVLSLSANAARIVVRDYHETTLANVKANLARWFSRLEIVDRDGQPARPPSVHRLASSLYRDANKEMPAHVPTSLVVCAITGRPLPDYLLGLAVKRNLAMQGPYAEFNGKRYLSIERLALIKAILEHKENQDLSALNVHHPDPAYHCGRLLAVLEQVQRSALGDINSTLVDRYYGAACSSPGTILGNLVNDAQSHLAKMRKGSGDGWAQNRLGEILSSIGDEFPRTLSLHRQGLFALGFYHQKAHDRAAAIETRAAKEAAQGAQA